MLKRIVHGAVTVDTPGQGLVTVQLDHGTLQTIGQGTITISEAGGARVTIATASDTRVRRNGQRGNVDDLRAGDTVYALSGIPEDGGNPVARLILVPQVPES